MKKFFLVAMMIFLTFSICSAEHPKAQEYRTILMSGSFYVEYDNKNVKRIVAQENGRRMSRTDLGGSYRAIVSILNPIGNFFAGEREKYPEFMYENGKFYKFLEKDIVLTVSENQLDDENLNPAEGWNMIYQSLSLPNELAVFNWRDKFHKVPAAMNEPLFVGSTRKVIGGREYDCDRYESKILNAAGDSSATVIFELCYMNDELLLAQSSLETNGKQYEINRLNIKKFLPAVPSGSFKLNGNEKIHMAGFGDMNDLLEILAFIGRLNEVR